MLKSEELETVKAYLNIGIKLRKEGKIASAIEQYSETLHLNPNYIPALNQLAEIYESTKEFDQAITYLQRVIKLQPNNGLAQARLAKVMMAQKNIEGAIAAYQKAIALQPKQRAWVYIGMGDALNENGQIENAIAAYRKAIEIKPDISPAKYKNLGHNLQKQVKFEETIDKKISLVRGTGKEVFFRQFLNLYQDNISCITSQDKHLLGTEKFFYVVGLRDPRKLSRNYCRNQKIKHFVADISPSIKDYLRQRLGFLVLDTSGEGPSFSAKNMLELYDIGSQLEISASQIIWLNQNLAMSNYHEKWAEANSISRENRIKILFWHSYVVLFSQECQKLYPTKEKRNKHILYFLSLRNIRQKRFLCLNNAPRPHRVFILLQLIKYNLVHQGLISFSSLKSHQKLDFLNNHKQQKNFRNKFPNYANLVDNLSELEAVLPMMVDSPSNSFSSDLVKKVDIKPYINTYFSLVTETGMSRGSVNRFTEKVLKPILNFHPFIVAGEPKTLSLLRDMGFKTFDGFFDESYDDIEDPEKRAMHVIEEVNRLCLMPIEKLHDLYLSMLPILVYNAEHLLNYIPTWIRAQMGAEIIYKFRTYAGTFN